MKSRMTNFGALLSIGMLLFACGPSPAALPTQVTTTPGGIPTQLAPFTPVPGRSATPTAAAHMDHTARHGGTFVMSQSLHIEVVSARPGDYQIYLYDLAGAPLPLNGVSLAATLKSADGAVLATLTPRMAEGGDRFLAAGGPTDVTQIEMALRVTRPQSAFPDEISVHLKYTDVRTPTPSAIATKGATPFALRTLRPGSGSCASDYFPAGAGNRWQYRDNRGVDLLMSVAEAAADRFTLSLQAETATDQTRWLCQSEGLAATGFSSDLGLFPTGFGWRELEYRSGSVSGLSLPAKLGAGATWEVVYLDVEGKERIDGGHGLRISGSVTRKFRLVDSERLTVPAGSFFALKFQVDIVENLAQAMHGDSNPNKFTYTGETWLAAGVGVVKSSIARSDGTYVVELVSYTSAP